MSVTITDEPVADDEVIKDPLYRRLEVAQQAQLHGNLEVAAKGYVAVLHIDPENVFALHNLSVVRAAQGHLTAAVASARRAIGLAPDQPYLMANLGSILTRMEHYEAAVQVFERLVEHDPRQFMFWHNLAHALTPLDLSRAVECVEHALDLAPCEARVRRDAGLFRLKAGRWEGYRDWREASLDQPDDVASMELPQWTGEPLDGKTIVVYHEQGFGDTIQFCRFLRPALADAERVILAAPAAMVRLMEDSNVVDEVVVFGDPVPREAVQCPLMGVFAYRDIGPFLERPFEPYLVPPVRGPRIRRGPQCVLTVGVAWAGNPNYSTDRLRSMPFEHVLSIADIPGVELVSLVKGDAANDIQKYGAQGLIGNPSQVIADVADLAHVVEQLDLVVSVDTVALHLAGALSVPCLGLLPYNGCWRWGDRSTDETSFYLLTKLIRQERPGDWVGVMIRVRETIAEVIDIKVGGQR